MYEQLGPGGNRALRKNELSEPSIPPAVEVQPPIAAASSFKVTEWRPFLKNTLRGFLSLEFSSGLILHGCTFHEKNDSRWIGLPARPYENDGERSWSPMVEFNSKKARDKFMAAALAALDAYLREEASK
jgi:hypothetical protein